MEERKIENIMPFIIEKLGLQDGEQFVIVSDDVRDKNRVNGYVYMFKDKYLIKRKIGEMDKYELCDFYELPMLLKGLFRISNFNEDEEKRNIMDKFLGDVNDWYKQEIVNENNNKK